MIIQEKMEEKKAKNYIETIGRRKSATARVRISSAPKMQITVNEKEMDAYFPTDKLRRVATESFSKLKLPAKFKITALVRGGGAQGQAVALRHGISRALIEYDPELRKRLKKAGFLKRDPRRKERKKFGLKKARKAPQWSKR